MLALSVHVQTVCSPHSPQALATPEMLAKLVTILHGTCHKAIEAGKVNGDLFTEDEFGDDGYAYTTACRIVRCALCSPGGASDADVKHNKRAREPPL